MSELPREPMPASWKPFWRLMAFLTGVTVAIGIVSAILNLLIQP